MKGQAADFVINGVNPLEIAQYAESIGVKGIGLYGPEDGNFVHIDTRSGKYFWYGHKQEYRDTFAEKKVSEGIYAVTCRVNGMEGVYTLLFDRSVGSQIQPISGYDVAVKMEAGTTKFEPVCMGRDTLEIIKITKLGA
jgi:hypothetical protein